MIEIIFQTPYVIRVFASLIAILIINKLTGKLWLSILSGIITISLWTGYGWQSIITHSFNELLSANNIFLMIIVFHVILLSAQMSNTGVMADLVNNLKQRVSKRNAMALLPAFIGLLPMPGGAIFSAPLVDDVDQEKEIDPVVKTTINYWFRHVWEYWWPLYPGIILAVGFTGLSIIEIITIQFPLCIAAIWGGYFFLLRKIKVTPGNGERDNNPWIKEFILLILPIIIIIIIFVLITVFFPGIIEYNKYLPMILSILAAQIVLQIQRPLSIRSWREVLFTGKKGTLVLVVALVRIYGAFIESSLPDGTYIMSHMRIELGSLGIPLLLIIMIIPFFCGITTGIAIGFVGASFPIVMNLIGAHPDKSLVLATTVLAYGCGFMGVMLSPVHVCLIVTNTHFKTGVLDSILRLVKPALTVMATSVIMYFVIRGF